MGTLTSDEVGPCARHTDKISMNRQTSSNAAAASISLFFLIKQFHHAEKVPRRRKEHEAVLGKTRKDVKVDVDASGRGCAPEVRKKFYWIKGFHSRQTRPMRSFAPQWRNKPAHEKNSTH